MIALTNKVRAWAVRQGLKSKAKRRQRIRENLSQKERLVSKIVKGALYDRSNVLLTAPISGKKFIKMPEQDVFIILNDCNIIISNHKFYYDIDLSMDFAEMINSRFDKILEHQRHLMEKEMTANIVDGLSDIADTLQERMMVHKTEKANESRNN